MLPLIPVVVAVSVLTAIAGAAYGCDQEAKREEEQRRARAAIAELEERISELERKQRYQRRELGNKNRQVRALADEITRLRAELEEARRRAA